jgi:hypothetical protein
MRTSSHRVEALEGRKGLARFIDVPWHLFDRARYPQWSPPLRTVMRDLLDPARDPFYKNADIRMFVATDGTRPLGRIAALENRSHNRHLGDRVGFFGFFECVDDPAVAADLFAAAEEWLRGRGLDVCRGPVNPSMNHECGLLVDGCDRETMVLTPWNPAYYDRVVSAAGYAKAKDLLAYEFPLAEGFRLSDRMAHLASRASERARLTFRDMDLRHATKEMRYLWPVFTEAWEGNWGFVPPDVEEFIHLAKGLLPLMVPKLCTVAEMNGEPVGFWLSIRNFNKVFQKIPSGRLGPAALWHLLVSARKVSEGRVAVFGIRSEARRQGLFPVFAHEAMVRSAALGITRAEGSWILEDNVDLTSPLESLGARAYRRWRIYDKVLR